MFLLYYWISTKCFNVCKKYNFKIILIDWQRGILFSVSCTWKNHAENATSFAEMDTKADKNLFRSIINQKCHCHVQWSLLSLVLTNKRNSSTDWLCKLLAIGCMLYYLFNYLECRYSDTSERNHNLSNCHFLHQYTYNCLLKHLAYHRPSWSKLDRQELKQ